MVRYDPHDEREFDTLVERMKYGEFLQSLLKDFPPQSYWRELLSRYFTSTQNDLFTVIAIPSIERANEIAEEEKRIVEKRQQDLGMEILEEYDVRNEEAQEANETPIPESVFDTIQPPSIANIQLRDYCSCVIDNNEIKEMIPSQDNNVMNVMYSQANEVLKSSPLYPIQLIHYNTQFSSFVAVFSTQSCTERELLFLPIMMECLLDCPQMVNGVKLSSEEVIDLHYKETETTESRLSIPGDSRYFSSGLECVSFRVSVDGDQSEKGLSLLHNLLLNSIFTSDCVEKVLSCNDKLYDEKNHDNDRIALIMARRLLLKPSSCHYYGRDYVFDI